MRRITIVAFLFLVLFGDYSSAPTSPSRPQPLKPVPQRLMDNTVFVAAKLDNGDMCVGTGVVITRNNVNYVWTDAHVIADVAFPAIEKDKKSGMIRVHYRFGNIVVSKYFQIKEQEVGIVASDAEVIRYDPVIDLALLRLKAKVLDADAKFYDGVPSLGDEVYHCGNMLGHNYDFSFSSGVVSHLGRWKNGLDFDQTTCTAATGCSGGGVYLKDGRCIGLLDYVIGDVGKIESLNLIIPIRRMRVWAKKEGIEFALDDTLPVPTLTALPSR